MEQNKRAAYKNIFRGWDREGEVSDKMEKNTNIGSDTTKTEE